MTHGTRLDRAAKKVTLQRRLQVWVPRTPWDLGVGDHFRGALEAYRAYRGEMIVTWNPRRRKPRESWWESKSGRYNGWKLDIRGAAKGVVDIFHVGLNGFVWGPNCDKRFPGKQIDGLLDRWLQANAEDPAGWPTDTLVSLPARELWPWEAAAQRRMVAIAGRSRTDPVGALLDATALAVVFVTESYALFRDAEFAPTMVEHGREKTLLRLETARPRGKRREVQPLYPRDPRLQRAIGGNAPIVDKDLQIALRHDPFPKEWLQLVPVRRCWGVEGLYWALLIDRLESSRSFNLCTECGRPLPKPRTKCGANDSHACFAAQARKRQRITRSRRLRTW
jgi:hypothetical protein